MSLVTNRKAGFNYEILEKYTAGMELFGFEVKSLRKSQGSLEGSYVNIKGGEAWIIGLYIPPYQVGNTPKEYDPYRERKLLLTKKEIMALDRARETKGLTIVPLSVYNKNGILKVEIAIAKGKKKFDKRETLKKQTALRDVERDLKDH